MIGRLFVSSLAVFFVWLAYVLTPTSAPSASPADGQADDVAALHPLDALTDGEYATVREVLQAAGKTDASARYHLIDLVEPPKAEVKAWAPGDPTPDPTPRRARAVVRVGKESYEAEIDLRDEALLSWTQLEAEPMVLLEEFLAATALAAEHPEMRAGLEKRGLSPEDVFCLPLTAGNFFDGEADGARLMKAPCFVKPDGTSNWYSRPVEGLFATIDLDAREVVEVTDAGVAPIAEDPWGYTEEEVAEKYPLRPPSRAARLAPAGPDGLSIDGSLVEWDMWRFHLRAEKRAGLVLSLIEANDGRGWRSVLYQAHLSEVFVPYMDPSEAFYWRTYMDSGEYGFGLFLSPLRPGTDCPRFARFLPARLHDDEGEPMAIPNAICLFERNIGDAAWRHYEVFAQGSEAVPAEGRPGAELVVRSASQVGNYDYFIDYVFQLDGKIRIMIGSTGIDAVKGVAAERTTQGSTTADRLYGTLVAENLVAPNHDHFFNFRLDFDIDGTANRFMRTAIVPGEPEPDALRRSYWVTETSVPKTEDEAAYRIAYDRPAMYHVGNPNVESGLGHHPAYMILAGGGVAYSPLDVANDPPAVRNAYIDKTFWVTPHDPEQRYAGGRYPFQSDGRDTLARWVEAGRSIDNTDIVVWTTLGFHHVPHMEDWPVMPTMWKGMTLAPFNFFDHNPALTARSAP